MGRRALSSRALTRRTALVAAGQAVALLAAACASPRPPAPLTEPAAPSTPSTPSPTSSPTSAPPTNNPATTPTSAAQPILLPTEGPGCASRLATVVPPTPIPYPGYTEREPSTGLHVTAPPQAVDVATYELHVFGKVKQELRLTYDELRCLPKIRAYSRIECPGFFVDWSNLAGASLLSVLDLAKPLDGSEELRFTGVDQRASTITLANARASKYFLAYEWEGEALPVSHGFPVRASLTDNAGGSWVKWLMTIEVS